MGSGLVVVDHPPVHGFADVLKACKQVLIQHLFAECAVEAFDESVLVRLAGLYVLDGDAIGLGPCGERFAQELRQLCTAMAPSTSAPRRMGTPMKSTDGVPTTGPRTIPSWRATSHAGPRTERAKGSRIMAQGGSPKLNKLYAALCRRHAGQRMRVDALRHNSLLCKTLAPLPPFARWRGSSITPMTPWKMRVIWSSVRWMF